MQRRVQNERNLAFDNTPNEFRKFIRQMNLEIFIFILMTILIMIVILIEIIMMMLIIILIMAMIKKKLFDDVLFSKPENAATNLK